MRTILRLLVFLRPFAGWVFLSILLGSAAVACGIGLLGTSASLIARAALRPSIAELQVAIVGVRFFGLSRGIFRYLERLASHSVYFRLLADLRGWFYRSIEPLAPARLIDIETGDLLARAMLDIDTLENFYVRVVAPPITALMIIIGVGWFAGNVDPEVGLTLVSGLLVGGLLIPLLAHLINRKTGRALVAARARISAALVEGLQGISDLIAFSWSGEFLKRVESHNRQLQRAQRQNGWAQGAVSALSLLTAQITLAAVLWLIIPKVNAGNLEGYMLAVLALVVLASFEAVAPLPQAAQQLESSLHSARRLFDLSDRSPKDEQIHEVERLPVAAQQVILTIDQLSFCYPGHPVKALDYLSLELTPGRKIAVVGPSGAGKSTLVNLLLRFVEVPPGSIRVNGRGYTDFSEDECRRLFAVISQSTYLFSASVRQNLLMAKPDASERQLIAALERARLGSWLSRLPHGLDSWVGEHGLHLSAGERQRLALARMLLKDAPILLLDEPTAHLDPLLEEHILSDLFISCGGKSLILISHRLVGMDRMEEILVLDHGQVVERGSHLDLIDRRGLYARMWAAQRSLLAE